MNTESRGCSWTVVRLGDVCDVVNGFGFPEYLQGHTGLIYPFIKVSDMNAPGAGETVSSAANTVDDAIIHQLHAHVYPAGTVIFPKVGGALMTNKKRLLGTPASFDNNVMGLVPKRIYGRYLFRWFQTVDLRLLSNTQALPSVRQSAIAALNVPLPPIPEQKRIAAKLDEQMAAVDRAEQALADQQAAASLLTAAVLRGILASPFSGTWPLVSLREASYIISKGTTPTSIGLAFSQSGIPFIRAEDIQGGEIDIRSVRMHIDEPTSKVLARSSLQPGDLLVTIAGTLGRVGYVPDDTDELNCNQAVAFVRLKPEILNVQYACISLQNGILASRARADGAGNSIQNMSLAQLGELTLPVPPLVVQRQLVSSMRAAQDRVKSTLTSIEGRLAAATALKAALLDAAFSGEV